MSLLITNGRNHVFYFTLLPIPSEKHLSLLNTCRLCEKQ